MHQSQLTAIAVAQAVGPHQTGALWRAVLVGDQLAVDAEHAAQAGGAQGQGFDGELHGQVAAMVEEGVADALDFFQLFQHVAAYQVAAEAVGEDGFYNINADVAASEVASALGADKLVYLTDVDGLFRDVEDEESLISQLTKSEAEELLGSGTLSAGMIPKISSVVEALKGGVKEVHLLNGTFSHALLLEVFTDAGIGTMIVQDEE